MECEHENLKNRKLILGYKRKQIWWKNGHNYNKNKKLIKKTL